MKPSEALHLHRDAIRSVVAQHQACNPRVFGSTLHGDDTDDSDLDLLIDPIPGKTSLASIVRMRHDIEYILGIKVDIHTPLSLHEKFRAAVLHEALAV